MFFYALGLFIKVTTFFFLYSGNLDFILIVSKGLLRLTLFSEFGVNYDLLSVKYY